MSALSVSGLTVDRAGRTILDDVSLEVSPGECLAIVGESGAGKSVLARTLLGLTQQDPGWRVRVDELTIGDDDLGAASARTWRRVRGSRVGLVLQDALQSLDPLRTIEAEVGEALAVRGIRRGDRRGAVLAALDAARLPGGAALLGRRSTELSGGMRQRALLASALVGSPAVLVADEPTTALDPMTANRVLALFRDIAGEGTAVVFISHDLASVSRIADRIAVIDRGRIVETGPGAALLSRPQHPATRRLVAAIPRGAKPTPSPTPGSTLLTLDRVSRTYATPDGSSTGVLGVDLELRRGEALGVVGESGAGKSTLARLLIGAEKPDGGRLVRGDAAERVRLIPQDPLATFDPRWRVERVISASLRRARGAGRGERPARSPADLLELVGLDRELLRRRPATLSGGQRQRVAIARALAADPDVLVCDEPVSALDVSTQAGILNLLRDLQARGVTIVFISHDLSAVRTVCDRLVIMRDGRIVEQGETERVFAAPQSDYGRELISEAVPGSR